MADDNKFPHFPAFPEFREDEDFKKTDTRGFVGSINTKDIAAIVALRCNNKKKCDKLLIDSEGSPKTGYCGHFFCSDCANQLYHKFETKRNAKLHGQARDIKYKHFEIYCDGGPTEIKSLYECKGCDKEVTYSEKDCFLRIFSDNIMLHNLYNALKAKCGFRCRLCPKGYDMHPKFNSLYCKLCERDPLDNKAYICVWHSEAHMTKTGHTLRIPSDSDKPTNEDHTFPLQLVSLDRFNCTVVAALYHCALCSNSLEDDTNCFATAFHLECGHFIGVRCKEEARKRMDIRMKELSKRGAEMRAEMRRNADGDSDRDVELDEVNGGFPKGLFCNFCEKDPVKMPAMGLRPVFPPIREDIRTKLHDIVFRYPLDECKVGCKKCDLNACRTRFSHPTEIGRCLWCKIEHLLNKDTDCKGK